MKKNKKIVRLAAIFLACLFLLTAVSPAFAASGDLDTSLSRVVDNAGLLTDSQETKLKAQIEVIQNTYQYDVVVLTETSIGSAKTMNYADDYYDYRGYGYGSAHDGMLFLLVMDTRDYWTSTTGYGMTAFTDYGLKQLHAACLSSLKSGDYYNAFSTYLSTVSQYLKEAKAGHPVTRNAWKEALHMLPVQLLAGIAISLIIVFAMKKMQQTAKPQLLASEYVKKDSFQLRVNSDRFLYANTVRRHIEKSSSGGGGSHTGSSGTSHGGGGGKF